VGEKWLEMDVPPRLYVVYGLATIDPIFTQEVISNSRTAILSDFLPTNVPVPI